MNCKINRHLLHLAMAISFIILLLFLLPFLPQLLPFHFYNPFPHSFSAQHPHQKTAYRLSKPLIGDDGRIYTCSERHFFAFESNGSIAWSIPLNYTCDATKAPVHGGKGKIYLVAENRVLKVNVSEIGTSKYATQVFFGEDGSSEIVGLSVSTPSSSVYISAKHRGLFAYTLRGDMIWSAGPVLYRSGYRLGCKKNLTDCFFTSAPVIDQCEASLYISNTDGELYSLSVRSPYFKWIKDFSSLDTRFTVTAGNNGRLYVTVPARALVLALESTTGNVLWQQTVGPLSTAECNPVVDSNGWISIGSLDGFLYSFSPIGYLKKFSKAGIQNPVLQVSPIPDCSGYAVYISQSETEGKVSREIGDCIYISALKPKRSVFSLVAPATSKVYWSESYDGHFSTSLSKSDLHHFVLDESILLAFVAASKTGNPLACRSTSQKIASSCAQATSEHLSIYIGNEKAIALFLFFESLLLASLIGLVRFCCIFWRKKKIQGQKLGSFFGKRRSLQLKKKEFHRTITELEKKAADEAVGSEVLEELGNAISEKEGIERKLSTTYSLGRDGNTKQGKSILPLYDGKTKSYSFQGSKRENVTIFHSLSDTSSSSSEGDGSFEESLDEAETSGEHGATPFPSSLSSSGLMSPMSLEHEFEYEVKMDSKGGEGSARNSTRKSSWLKRRTLSSTN